jgi:hypothetical protein
MAFLVPKQQRIHFKMSKDFPSNRPIWVLKDTKFYADLKNVHILHWWKNAPRKVLGKTLFFEKKLQVPKKSDTKVDIFEISVKIQIFLCLRYRLISSNKNVEPYTA